jgi:hypothetical protein
MWLMVTAFSRRGGVYRHSEARAWPPYFSVACQAGPGLAISRGLLRNLRIEASLHVAGSLARSLFAESSPTTLILPRAYRRERSPTCVPN